MKEHILVEVLSNLTSLTEEEKIDIENSFPIANFGKGKYLLKEGQVAKEAYFVITGLVREFKLCNGLEQTTAFLSENQSVINFTSMNEKSPSKISFICEEDTLVAIVNPSKEEELYTKHPRFEAFCRSGVEQMMGAKQDQLSEFITLNPEQRYIKLREERPDLINRVPQYHIASYLGIKPETLSRIRKRIATQT